jgi:hypothetical protein
MDISLPGRLNVCAAQVHSISELAAIGCWVILLPIDARNNYAATSAARKKTHSIVADIAPYK